MDKNIAIIVSNLYGGGAERIAGLLSKKLEDIYNVYLFLENDKNAIYDFGGTVVNVRDYVIKNSVSYIRALRDLKNKYNIHVSISFLEGSNFSNILSRASDRVIISERCAQSQVFPRKVVEDINILQLYSYADEIIACSYGVQCDLIKEYNQNESRISVIYNFIDKEKIYMQSRQPMDDETVKWLDGADFLLCVGRLHPQKNHKRLINQFIKVHKDVNPKIKLLIKGSGELEDEIKSMIAESSMESFIKVISYTDNPFTYMSKALALISASEYEGLPNVILEAMALGIPVVAVDCLYGPRELLQGQQDYGFRLTENTLCERGILVPNFISDDFGNTDYLARAMKIIIEDKDIRNKIVHAQKEYMEQYSNGQILKAWKCAIENEYKQDVDIAAKLKKSFYMADRRFIYGAGKFARKYYNLLKGDCSIDAFIVTEESSIIEPKIDNIPVVSVNNTQIDNERDAILIGVSDIYKEEIVIELSKKKISNFYFADNWL